MAGHLWNLKNVNQKSVQYKKFVVMVFVNYEKASDIVEPVWDVKNTIQLPK